MGGGVLIGISPRASNWLETSLDAVVKSVFSADDDCVDGAKDVRTSSRARAPPTEMVEHTRKNTIFSIHLKKKLAPFRHDFLLILIVRLWQFLWRYFNDKCPERIIVMRERNKCLRSQDSLHSHTTQMLSLSRSDIRLTCVCSNLILSPGFNVARRATASVGNGHPPAET